MKLFFILFTLVSFSAFSEKWVVNKDHSEVKFEVEYLSVSKVSGRFSHFLGSLNLKDKKPEDIFIMIETDSIYTGQALRDGHLRSNEFFEAKRFPFIEFKSLLSEKITSNEFRVEGELKIKNISKKVELILSISDSLADTWNKKSRFVEFTTVINRKDFGLNWDKSLKGNTYLVGEKISIFGTIQIQPAGDKTNSSKHLIPATEYRLKREKFNRGELGKGDIYIPSIKSDDELRIDEVDTSKINAIQGKQEIEKSPIWYLCFIILSVFCVFTLPLIREFFINGRKDIEQKYILKVNVFVAILVFLLVISLNGLFFYR